VRISIKCDWLSQVEQCYKMSEYIYDLIYISSTAINATKSGNFHFTQLKIKMDCLCISCVLCHTPFTLDQGL